jgi:hypothetical protein
VHKAPLAAQTRRSVAARWTSGLAREGSSGHPENCDQIRVIRENPASRGTETSAEVLVGPPWRMESNAGQQQRY